MSFSVSLWWSNESWTWTHLIYWWKFHRPTIHILTSINKLMRTTGTYFNIMSHLSVKYLIIEMWTSSQGSYSHKAHTQTHTHTCSNTHILTSTSIGIYSYREREREHFITSLSLDTFLNFEFLTTYWLEMCTIYIWNRKCSMKPNDLNETELTFFLRHRAKISFQKCHLQKKERYQA